MTVLRKSEKATIHVEKKLDGEFPGLDIREYIESEKYTGPTKKGVRIPLEMLPDFLKAVNEA